MIKGFNNLSGGIGADTIEFATASRSIFGGNLGWVGDYQTDEFILSSWDSPTTPSDKEALIGDFEVGIDILNLSELGIQANHTLVTQNGVNATIHIDNGVHNLSFNVRTGNLAMSQDDIIYAT